MTHHLVGMAEIAEMLGVSRQRVSQLVTSYEDFPAPEAELAGGRVWSRTAIETWIASHPDRGPGRRPDPDTPRSWPEKLASFLQGQGLFKRFSDDARSAIVHAQEEARLLQHSYIGTEHLLLGLLRAEENLAARALGSLGVTLEDARARIADMIGEGKETPAGHIPFTPRSKKVLELALREALELGHNTIGAEHVMLALVTERHGVGWQALEAMGLDATVVKSAVLTELARRLPRATTRIELATEEEQEEQPPRSGEVAINCSFCGKSREQVEKVIAGPGAYICSECIDLCNEIFREERGEPGVPTLEALTERITELSERLAELEKKDD